MLRILVVTRSTPLHRGSGGMERVSWDLAAEWSRLGHGVTVITTPWAIDSSTTRHGDLTIKSLPGRPGKYTESWARRVAELNLSEYDVVLGVSAAARSLLRTSTAVPVVMQAHGTSIGEILTKFRVASARSLATLPRNLFWLLRDARDYPRYAAVVGVGALVTTHLRRLPAAARPRDYREISNPAPRTSGRRILPWSERNGVAFVGRLHREKGTDRILQLAGEYGLQVVVAGDGPEAAQLVSDAARLPSGSAGSIRLTGRLAPDAVLDLIGSSRALVFPSRRQEGLPLVVLEALAVGTPVVASVEQRPLLALARPGFRTATTNSEFAGLVAHLHDGPDPGVAAIAAASQTPTLQAVAAQYLALFRELIHEGGSR